MSILVSVILGQSDYANYDEIKHHTQVNKHKLVLTKDGNCFK